MSTKTQTTAGPSARASRAAQTAESTPPESPQTTRSVGSDPTLDLGERPLDERPHRPGSGDSADAVEEVAEDQRAVGRVGDFGMKLEPVERQLACRTAAIGQVAVVASGTKSGPASWTWSPWLIQTVVSCGTP